MSTLAATAACALGAVPAASAATDVAQASSENWSGYVVGSGSQQSSSQSFKSVSGSWVAPTAKCSASQTYSAFWVGLGGSGNTEALEQAGTEADCTTGGTASYHAWYELVPSAPVTISSLAVHPGDHVSSRVTVNGTSVTVSVSDSTTGQSFSKTLHMSDPDTSSAEWIAEAPSSCDQAAGSCTPLPLTDFGTVQFSSASATSSDGHTGTISDPEWSAAAVSLDPSAGQSGFQGVDLSSNTSSGAATPSSLSSDGASFSVAYAANGSGDVSGAGGSDGQGQGYGGYPGGSGNGYGGYGGGGYGGSGNGYGYGGYPGGGYGGGGYGWSGGYGGWAGGGYGYTYGYEGYAPISR